MNDLLIDRIKKLIEIKKLNSSKLADDLGISRSRLSHILTGRNNPSLEIVQSLLTKFPEINPDWLLFGKQTIYRNTEKESNSEVEPDLFHTPKRKEYDTKIETKRKEEKNKVEETIEFQEVPKPELVRKDKSPAIKMITIFYDNNEYAVFYPETK